MLQIKRVRKTFNETVILQEISLLCERGKIYGIMGRNGSGKSVLFKCICGFLEIDNGEIVLDDQVLSNGKMGNKRVGFIIENPAFLPQYSGFQNLVMLYSINNKMDTQVIKQYMNMVGLDPDDTTGVLAPPQPNKFYPISTQDGYETTIGYCAGYYGISTIINFG